MVMSERATFALAVRLRTAEGAPLGELFAFMSGLYFRGKLAYSRAFARPPDPASPISGAGSFVITPNAGLRSIDTPVTLPALRNFAGVDIDAANPKYRRPLEVSARAIAEDIGPECAVVLLGSIASPKYVDVLAGHLRAAAGVSRRLRRPRRHEPRRPDAARGHGRRGADVHFYRRCRPAWREASEADSPQVARSAPTELQQRPTACHDARDAHEDHEGLSLEDLGDTLRGRRESSVSVVRIVRGLREARQRKG